MEYFGYAGAILHVDLTSGEIRKEPLDLDLAKRFIGGFGMDGKLAYDLIRPGTDPLSPENAVIISAGPLVGTMIPGAVRLIGTTKFPLTNAVFSGSGSMSFGHQMKWSGYDHLVITGKAKSPVYIKIFDDNVEICDAKDLWGRDLCDTTDMLRDEFGTCGVVAIGQAGENLVKMALALVDKTSTLGRGGLGAVMGSKNLKAVVAQGKKGIKIYDKKRLMRTVDGLFDRCKRYPLHTPLVEESIMALWDEYAPQGLFSGKNWTKTLSAERATELFGPKIYEKIKKGRQACPSCFNSHRDIIELREGEFAGLVLHCHTFLTAGMIGARFDIEDYTEAVKLYDLLNRSGLCLLSFVNLADFVIDLYERGVITESDTQGLVLSRDFSTAATLIEKIVNRDGFGDLLAEGWSETMNVFGKDSEQYAATIKGQECLRDPRVAGLGTHEFVEFVCPRGPCGAWGTSPSYMPGISADVLKRHAGRMGASQQTIDRIFDSPSGVSVGRYTKISEEWCTLFDSLGICEMLQINRFYNIDICAELYSAVTGIEAGPEELMAAAERNFNLFKAINVREGFSRKDDFPPDKLFKPTTHSDGQELHLKDWVTGDRLSRDHVETLLDDYYDEHGWDTEKGIPTKEKLIELGLDWVAEDLSGKGFI